MVEKIFELHLVKPSHYDDDGYVIQWLRSAIPSNSLAALHGIASDCADRQALGPDVRIDIFVYDETNTRIRPEKISEFDCAGRGRDGLHGRRAIQSVSARPGSGAAPSREKYAGRHWRLPCLGLPLHAARTSR